MKKVLSVMFILGLALFLNKPLQAQKLIGKSKTVKSGKVSVKYSNAEAFTDGNGVWIEWETEIESNNLGFYVYRVSADSNERINKGLVSGGYLRGESNSSGKYSYFDVHGDIGFVYYIQSLDTSGQVINSKMISPLPVEDLTAVAGISSKQLKKASTSANPDSLQSENELPDDLKLEVSQNAPQADAVMQRWVAAQPGVKIRIVKDGIYRVSRAELQSAGFDVNASDALWQLYVNGVEQSINVGDGGSFVEFYGRGIDTLESNTQTYYLVVGAQNGKRIGRTVRRPIGGRVSSSSFFQSLTKRERFNYTSTVLNGEAENFFGTVILKGSPATVDFNLPAVDFTVPNASIEIAIQGISLTSHEIRVVLNGVDIGAVSGNFRSLATRRYDIPTSYLRAGVNSLQLTALGVAGAADTNFFHSVKVSYARRYQAEQNQLSFYTNNYRASYLEGFTSPNIRVFDVTYPDSPTIVTGLAVELKGIDYRIFLPASRGRVMYAVEDLAILRADSISANTPSNLSATANDADLIIISHKDFIAQANDWADYRRSQGIIVKVVDVEDVFDEFNYGVLDSLSIRSFLQYAKSSWRTAPRYVLLIGDSTFDPKNNTPNVKFNFVPTKLVDTVYLETASDDTLSDFNNDGLAEIPIGRSPARNAAEVTQLLNKTKIFEQTSAQGFSRGAIFASDLPNGWDFEGTSRRLSNLLPTGTNRVLVNRGETDAKTRLLSEMNAGRFFINYAGHGSSAAWVSSAFFAKADAEALTNGNNLSVYTLLTCLNGLFTIESDSLAETLLKAQNGGAAAVWASTGDTTPDIQEIMATRFYQQLALGNIKRLGDLTNDAKTVINTGRDVRLSWALLGDPMLKVR